MTARRFRRITRLLSFPGVCIPLPIGWGSDTSLAYAIFRLTFGVNLMLRGVDRVFFLGLDNFGNGMVKQFEMTWIGAGMIQPFAHTLPWIEMVMGALIIVGLFTRPALVVGGL